MAKTNYYGKKKYSELERLAYNLGKIERGKRNSNSKVYESFGKGLNATQKQKKPLV